MAKVLIVDDNPEVRKTMRMYFESEGFEVSVAATVEQAAEMLEKRELDIVITDFRLVDLTDNSGLAVYKAAEKREVPSILMAASRRDVPEDVRFVAKARSADFLEEVYKLLGEED